MHMIISALVFADSGKEALSKASAIFERLTINQNPFDYYMILNDPVPAAFKADSDEGRKIIQEGMDATKQEFMENIKRIREILESHTDEMLFNKKQNLFEGIGDAHYFRFYCHCIGRYKGPNIWLYDQDGEGIRTEGHLERVLSKWECLQKNPNEKNPFEKLDIWVVPADVHF